MALRDLDREESAIVDQCLRAAVGGPFFPDWEFQTLIGVPREDVRLLAGKWQSGDWTEEDADVVTNVLNNLVGYPHGQHACWSTFISVQPSVLSTLLEKILASADD